MAQKRCAFGVVRIGSNVMATRRPVVSCSGAVVAVERLCAVVSVHDSHAGLCGSGVGWSRAIPFDSCASRAD